jgi:hypothetical protein
MADWLLSPEEKRAWLTMRTFTTLLSSAELTCQEHTSVLGRRCRESGTSTV